MEKENRILVIYFSQTGQLKAIADSFMQAFKNNSDTVQIDYYCIEPEQKFPFPWPSKDFYNAFPESYAQIPVALRKPDAKLLENKYDLVILAYQIWYLTPSIPINSFLKSEYAPLLLKDKKVITLIGCRNMWAKAQQKVKTLVDNAGGKIVGNIAFVDKHLNHISVVTIAHWMMGGKKDRKFGIFPKPGVSDKDIKSAEKFGNLALEAHQTNEYSSLQDKIKKNGGNSVHDFIIFMDETANKMFTKWSKFILKDDKNRARKVMGFKIYLLVAIWVISPIVYLLFLLSYPFRWKTIKQKRIKYCGI